MSTTCQRFAQNAWRKDLCSNCFKSKEEHKSIQMTTPKRSVPIAVTNITPPKGIMRNRSKKSTRGNVTFPPELTKVIGFGGEWADEENDDADTDASDTEVDSTPSTPEDISKEIDELEQELIRLTKVNTDFNMINGNLLGDPETNIKRSFAALKLGSPQTDSDGKKQTLKISVTPFGGQVTTNKVNNIKQKFNSADDSKAPVILKTIIKTSQSESSETFPSDSPIEFENSTEKSLMDEISETLARNKELKANVDNVEILSDSENKIKLEINKSNMDSGKRSLSRHTPIVKDQAKPKINVFPKFSDSDSNTSDAENSVSGYYDVVEAANSYENIPDGYNRLTATDSTDANSENRNQTKSSFFSNHLISEMFATKDNSNSKQSYSFMSKITSDGLIVTKATSDDALDSTGSSFEYGSSSDEEMSSMNRSESDSGIGICVISGEYKDEEKSSKNSPSADYEDIQVQDHPKRNNKFFSEKSRELAGEPDGSADPDGSNEAPALPSSPPPTVTTEPRKSFLHSSPTKLIVEKPSLPVKPTASIIKSLTKRPPNSPEQQVITQLQQIMKPPKMADNFIISTPSQKQDIELLKGVKKSRAPDPPSPILEESPTIYDAPITQLDFEQISTEEIQNNVSAESPRIIKSKTDDQYPYLYTRNPTGSISKSTSPVIREKDKRERATVNPKFRSLNTFSSQYKNQANKNRSSTPEPAPRNSLSLSQDSLIDDKKKKTKFSIKKFLRMGSNKPTESIYEKGKEGIYGKTTSTTDNESASAAVPQTKPRLVIIHPIDINNQEVEVVKELGKVNEIVTGKPPAPPLRKGLDLSKPLRPPPPKSAELRKKQKSEPPSITIISQSASNKDDNVYANLGEIRSAIAPRKPERTASMREREAQMEQARIRVTKKELESKETTSNQSTLDRDSSKSIDGVEMVKVSSRLQMFERSINDQQNRQSKQLLLSDGIKNSMQKMTSTIDSYLKDRMADTDSEPLDQIQKHTLNVPPAPSSNARHSDVEIRNNYEVITVNAQRSSLPDATSSSVILSGGGGVGGSSTVGDPMLAARTPYSKSDYGPSRYQNPNIGNSNRSISRSYCGSEISESDLYSPYSFYGSEAGMDGQQNDYHDGWNGHQQTKQRPTNRLRMRKGRSVVHKSIEDNYSAVVVANHEVLAQVLEQVQKTNTISPIMRPLANSINLRFDDFTILEGVRGVVAGRRAFHPAIWANQIHVTIALSADCNQMTDLNPVTEFCDLVPSQYLPVMPSTEIRMIQATISVLPRMLVDTLQSFGQVFRIRSENLRNQAFSGSTINLSESTQQNVLRGGVSVQNLSTFTSEISDPDGDSMVPQIPGMPSYNDLVCREVGFVMLQLVNALKNLQAKGIEELPLSLSNVILCKDLENKDSQARLYILHGLNHDTVREDDEQMGTLCECAHIALTTMFPSIKLTSTLSSILARDRSESLSKTKSVLEFTLWGPSDVPLQGTVKERELILQRWLDLERATILHGLVRSRVELSVYDESHLMFLVRSSAKNMCEASAILTGSSDLIE